MAEAIKALMQGEKINREWSDAPEDGADQGPPQSVLNTDPDFAPGAFARAQLVSEQLNKLDFPNQGAWIERWRARLAAEVRGDPSAYKHRDEWMEQTSWGSQAVRPDQTEMGSLAIRAA